ncbi:hypothetical protein HYU06_00085 [Candidatus Woesearchaeota archaeon]|nr:hypothetical protein [Candidatus Woesearchaeota archaeon]
MRELKHLGNRYSKLIFVLMIVIILVISLLTFVIAAGGGGGNPSPPPSPPPSSPGSSSSSSSSSSGSGVYFYGLTCDARGVIAFNKKPKFESVNVESADDGSVLKDIKGTWDGFKFTSDEAIMLKAGKYLIRDSQTNDLTVDYPGLKFSCKLVDLFIDECFIANNRLSAKFTLSNSAAEDLKIEFEKTDGKTIGHSKLSKSGELKELKVTNLGENKYSLELENAPEVKILQISHPDCIGEYYVYSKIGCMKKSDEKKSEIASDKLVKKEELEKKSDAQESGKKLKCGGYMDINDRVKCRVSLREEQAGEWENFFPEECKAWKPETQPKCLEFYTSVRECWKFENGNARINCVKRQVKLADILTEKANCNALEINKKEQCNKDLKDKVNAVVKFRLYNLEEEAERFYEEGKIIKDELVDFVVKMEFSKLEYNIAKDKQEKKNIILKARKAWIELVKKMKE